MQAGADIVPTYILGQSQVINVSACLMQGCQSISLDQATQFWSIAVFCFTADKRLTCKHHALLQVFVYKGSETLSRRLRCAIGIFYGRWYLPIPNKIRLTVLVGKPINVAKIEDPDASQVAFVYLCFDLHFNSVNTDDVMRWGCFVSRLTLCDMLCRLKSYMQRLYSRSRICTTPIGICTAGKTGSWRLCRKLHRCQQFSHKFLGTVACQSKRPGGKSSKHTEFVIATASQPK